MQLVSLLRPMAALTCLAAALAAHADDAATAPAAAPAAAAPADGAVGAEMNATVETPAATVTATTAANVALPTFDADEYFEGKTPGTFGKDLSSVVASSISPRVGVAAFRVVYRMESSASAQVRGSYLPGRDMTAAHASITVKLQGVDYAALQALTDQAYATFMEQLKASGREVVPLEKIQPLFGKLELAKASPEAPYAKDGAVVFSPTGMPLWWHHGDVPWGDIGFSQSNYKAFASYSNEVDAFLIAPTLVVDFARLSSSGNRSGLVARSAEVGAELEMGVRQINTYIAHATEVRYGTLSKGTEGLLRLKKGFNAPENFATMEPIEESKTSGFMAVLTGSAKSKKVNAAVTDNARYSATALPVLNQATGALARFFQQHAQ